MFLFYFISEARTYRVFVFALSFSFSAMKFFVILSKVFYQNFLTVFK